MYYRLVQILRKCPKLFNFLKKIINRPAWSYQSAIGMHVKIMIRQALNKLGLLNYNKAVNIIRRLQNSVTLKRCFIVCTGPSLNMNDIDRLYNEDTFGLNSIFRFFTDSDWRPTYYVMVDEYAFNSWNKEYNLDIDDYCKKYAFLNDNVKNYTSNRWKKVIYLLIHFGNHRNKRFKNGQLKVNSDISICLYDCFTVTNMAIQLAIYMGYKEIYLIGADADYSSSNKHMVGINTDEKITDEEWNKIVDKSIYGYQKIKKFANQNNVQIYNATRGGKLEVFPRVNFDELF